MSAQAQTKWVGTWSTAEQLVETANLPPAPGLTNNSLRQVVRVSIGGDTLRFKFSNDFSTSAVTLNSVKIAVSTGGGAINTSTTKQLRFGGNANVTMSANSSVFSDPIAFTLTPRMDLAITIYFGQTSVAVTGHPGSRTTSYILAGDQTSSGAFTGSSNTDHWYAINTIDVRAPNTAAAVAILGNSITDGRGSTTNGQDRWPDILSIALLNNPGTQQVGVLNQGVGGNCVLSFCVGPSGVSRYQRDILGQQGVLWVIVFEGVNDIGGVTTAAAATTVANNLINAYRQMITDAHAVNMKVYGATIMPFNGNAYYNQYSESCRRTVNAWIRGVGNYDAVIDFDRVTRSSTDTTMLGIASYQNDGLHPTAPGYQLMGQSVDLNLFTQTVKVMEREDQKGYSVGEIHSNRFNGNTMIAFKIPREAFVSLKVYSMLGKEIAELAGRKFSPGKHTVEFKSGNLSKGMYLYSFKADKFSVSRKTILPVHVLQ